MSLGHVYIVLEPVGFARLTFDDDRYYEFMGFDVPKVVRSPGCDHGHDEESQNSRDINIDILEGYVWTSEGFQMSSGSTGVPGVFGTPRGVNGPYWALKGEKRRQSGVARAPRPNPNWGRVWGGLSFSPSSLPSPS